MSTLGAIFCFFAALFFVLLAMKDKYVSARMYRLYGDVFGNHVVLFPLRLIAAALCTWGGVELLT